MSNRICRWSWLAIVALGLCVSCTRGTGEVRVEPRWIGGTLRLDNGEERPISTTTVVVPAGRYTMITLARPGLRGWNEDSSKIGGRVIGSRHPLVLDQSGANMMVSYARDPAFEDAPFSKDHPRFHIEVYEVSIGMYEDCVRAGRCSPAHFEDGSCEVLAESGRIRANLPLECRDIERPQVCVDAPQAQRYCGWEGRRLPEQSEWQRVTTDFKDEPALLAHRGKEACAPTLSRLIYPGDPERGSDSLSFRNSVSEWVTRSVASRDEAATRPGGYTAMGGTWREPHQHEVPADARVPRDDIGFRCAQDYP